MHILTSLDDYGTEAVLDETEGGKETARTLAHDDDTLARRHVGIIGGDILGGGWNFVDKNPYSKIHIYRIMAGIDTTFQYPDAIDGTGIYALLTSNKFLDRSH